MAKIKQLFIDFYDDRPRFILSCFRFFLLFLFWIALYLAAFTVRSTLNDPARWNVNNYEGVGRFFVFLWVALMLAFAALAVLKNDKLVKITGIVQIVLMVLYILFILLSYSLVLDEIDGYTGFTASLSFGFWMMLIIIGLLVISVFFTPLIEKVVAKLIPPQFLHPEPPAPAQVAPVEPMPVEPAPVVPEPVIPLPVEPMPIEPELVAEKPASPAMSEPPLSDPVHFRPTPVEPIETQPVIVEPKPES